MSETREKHRWLIEPDLWEALITAGACWRAARCQPFNKEWEEYARAYSDEASVLAGVDATTWRLDGHEPQDDVPPKAA